MSRSTLVAGEDWPASDAGQQISRQISARTDDRFMGFLDREYYRAREIVARQIPRRGAAEIRYSPSESYEVVENLNRTGLAALLARRVKRRAWKRRIERGSTSSGGALQA